MERAFLIAARAHCVQADGAPVELKTLIDCEARDEARDPFNLFVSSKYLSFHFPGINKKVDFHRQLHIDHSLGTS